MHNTPENKHKATLATKKSLGILAKVLEMIDQDEYCPDIIQQIDAAIGLLQSSKKSLLIGHLDHCLADNIKQNKDKTIKELIRIFDLN
jgi:CsoR family transcriptional regulator, copper-sensing transcriptional repressor